MKTILIIASGAVALAASAAVAAPENKPVNAAQQIKRDGCIVRGADDQAYQLDPDCSVKVTNKRDKSGQLVFQIYRDKGTLQPGQEIDKAFTFRDEFMIGSFECKLVEKASPGGQYSSFRHCRRAD